MDSFPVGSGLNPGPVVGGGLSDSFPVGSGLNPGPVCVRSDCYLFFGKIKKNFDRIFVSLMQSMMHDSVYE